MLEAGNFLEQYQVMSPRERNGAFETLVKSLPTRIMGLPMGVYDIIDDISTYPNLLDEFIEEYHPEPVTEDKALVSLMNLLITGDDENRRRREGSAYKRVFMSRVKALLSLSHITHACSEVVVDELSEAFKHGVDKGELSAWFTEKSLGYPILIDSEYQNGGLFSEDRDEVIEVERKYYQHVIRRWRLQAEEKEELDQVIKGVKEKAKNDPRWKEIKDEEEEAWRIERDARERGEISPSSIYIVDDLLERRAQEEALIHYVDSDEFRKKWREEFTERYGEKP